MLAIDFERTCFDIMAVKNRGCQPKGEVVEPVPRPIPSEAAPLMRRRRAGPIVRAGGRQHHVA